MTENKSILPEDSSDQECVNEEAIPIADENTKSNDIDLMEGDQAKLDVTGETVKKESTHDASESDSPNRRSIAVYFSVFLLVFILVSAVVGGGAYLALQEYEAQREVSAELKRVLSLQEKKLTEAQDQHNALRVEIANQANEIKALAKRAKASEDRLASHNNRLLSMSTTTREDWLLAEAEYLLKLANQRVLIEKNAGAADALLVEADTILRNLDDPDLFPLRQAIANDLAALRLTQSIDVEGIYLTLVALARQVETLPLRPTRQERMAIIEGAEEKTDMEGEGSVLTWREKISRSFQDLFKGLKAYIRFERHDKRPTPILPPDSAQYLQQNLRLMIERSQLALLREQENIYSDSLRQVNHWLNAYYPPSEKMMAFKTEIELLQKKNIIQRMPDISESLELLHGYIEQLHQLGGVKATK